MNATQAVPLIWAVKKQIF